MANNQWRKYVPQQAFTRNLVDEITFPLSDASKAGKRNSNFVRGSIDEVHLRKSLILLIYIYILLIVVANSFLASLWNASIKFSLLSNFREAHFLGKSAIPRKFFLGRP